MDTTQEYKTVLAKRDAGTPVSLRDVAVTLANDDQSLATYLIVNDYKQVYKLLNESEAPLVIGENARLIPSVDRVAAELHSLIEKKDWQDLNYILGNFRINLKAGNWTSHEDLLAVLRDIDAVKMDREGNYSFKLQFA